MRETEKSKSQENSEKKTEQNSIEKRPEGSKASKGREEDRKERDKDRGAGQLTGREGGKPGFRKAASIPKRSVDGRHQDCGRGRCG